MALALAKSCWAAGDAEPGPPPPEADDARRLRRGEAGGVAQRQALLPAMQIVVDSRDSADAQMAMDEALARRARATFRLFRWQQPAVSLGFKQPPPAWVEPGALAGHGIEVVERPTGGGIAVHGSDLSCSVVAPQEPCRALASLMEGVCEALAQGVRELGVPVVRGQFHGTARSKVPARSSAGRRPRPESCRFRHSARPCWPSLRMFEHGNFAQGRKASNWPTTGVPVEWTPDVPQPSRLAYCLTQPSPYALMVAGRKLCGLAIRRYRASWLIQGSLLVSALPAVFAQVMPAAVFEAFQARAITLQEAAGRTIMDEELIAALVQAWRTTWRVHNFYGLSTMDSGRDFDAL